MIHPQFLSAALCFLTISKFCIGADALSANETLVDGDVLISPSQMYEVGFFSPGSSTNRFLGIWYKATPDVVVWVANRENPIIGLKGVLNLAKNGSLDLTSAEGGATIWSSNSSVRASSPVLQIMDNGNLVVVENKIYIWQSFDYLGNTRLPGMKMVNSPEAGVDKHLTSWKSPDDPSVGESIFMIENEGLSQMTVAMGGKKQYRSGHWDGIQFIGFSIKFYQDLISDKEFSRDGKLISIVEEYNSSAIMRLTLSYSGQLQRYIMNEDRDGWVLAFSEPNDICNRYGWCGPNGICRAYKQTVCDCLTGFTPTSQKEWNVFAWTRGCRRNPSLDCQKEDGFLKVERIKLPDTLNFELNASMSIDDCHDECLKNCNCTAYANPYAGSERNACLMWFGNLIDIVEFTGEVRPGPGIYIRVPTSELDQNNKNKNSNKKKGPTRMVVVVAATTTLGSLALGLCFGVIICRIKRKRRDEKKRRQEFELPLFSLASIAAATKNFSDENMIGEGGFGPVYKGSLSGQAAVAVKRMSKTSGQGSEEFKNEVLLIAKLQHRNLVRILGCCVEGEEKMLVYEYMQNKSLDYFIFDERRSVLLSWPTRFDIIMGVAKGLLYLHHDSRLKVIHRDLKTSNILLDENLNAKISDFGLARMFDGNQTMASTKRVVGTYGYMAPEYAFDGKFSIKSDVFSMGVVILEIVSGKKNRGFKHPFYQNLLEQAWLFWKENRDMELMDQCYNSSYVERQVNRCIQVALLCLQSEADDRPMMPSVILMLSSEDTVLPEPKKPGFCLHSSSDPAEKYSSGNSVTMSEVEGR